MCKNCAFCGSEPKIDESAVGIEIYCDCGVSPYVSNDSTPGVTKKEVRLGWNYLQVHKQAYLVVSTQLEGNFSDIPMKGTKETKFKCPSCIEDGRKYNLKYISSQGIYGCLLCDSLFLDSDLSV